MSWSIGFTVTDVNELDELADRIIDNTLDNDAYAVDATVSMRPVDPGPNFQYLLQEARMQLHAAVEVARVLVGVNGSEGDSYRVNLSGHANPEFAPHCSVSVHVAQQPAEKTDE